MAKKAPDTDVQYFHYESTLSVDPPLPDSKIKAASSDFLKCTQHKDEDVTLDGSGNIVVVTNNVTRVEATNDKGSQVYNYAALKAGVQALAKVASDAGSTVTGDVIVKAQNDDEEDTGIFRLRVENGKAVVEGAKVALAWPDGTSMPSPW